MRCTLLFRADRTDLYIIITGRYALQNLIDFADLVTEIRMAKHPFAEQSIRVQAGIEY